MYAKHLVLWGGIVLAGLASLTPAAVAQKDGKDRDFEALAQNVVTRSARIAERDLVQINGNAHAEPPDVIGRFRRSGTVIVHHAGRRC